MSRVLGDLVERALTGTVRKEASAVGEQLLTKSLATEGMTGALRSTDAWFSTVHNKVNSYLESGGKSVGPGLLERFNQGTPITKAAPRLDIYGAYKAVDNGLIASGAARDRLIDTLKPILKGVRDDELAAYGEMLPHPEEHWGKIAEQFQLSGTDTAKVRALKDFDTLFKQETGNSIVEGMQKMQLARSQTLPGGTIWDDMIEGGHLNPVRSNIAEVITQGLNKGLNDKYLAEPLKGFEEVMNAKGPTGAYTLQPVRWVMENYARYVEGIPDQSRRIMEKYVDNFSDWLTEKTPTVAKGLGLDTGGKGVIQKATTWAAAAGLGLRPAILLRDVFDWHRPLSVMGPDFIKGMARAMTKDGWEQAETVAMRGKNINEIWGGGIEPGIFNDIPTKAAELILRPTRWGNDVGRKAAYLGEYDRVLQKVSDFRSGTLDTQGLINGTGLFFHDPAPRSQLLQMAMNHSIPVTQVADAFGRQMVDSTLFSMRYGGQGALLRTGAGRVLGQYGQWPLNYLEFLKRLGRSTVENPVRGLPTFASWVAINQATIAAGKANGVDLNNWGMFAPAAYTGGPYLSLLSNLAASADEGPRGRQARHDVLMFPVEGMIPGGAMLRNLWRSVGDNEFNTDAGYIRLLGFRPVDKDQHLELDEWLRKEAGFGTGRGR